MDGTGDAQSKITAQTINFDPADLQLAETIQAGLNPTQQQQQTNMSNIQANKDAAGANKQAIGANKQAIAANQSDIAANQSNIAANQQDIAATTKRFSET